MYNTDAIVSLNEALRWNMGCPTVGQPEKK
jgi:hypothetical protein